MRGWPVAAGFEGVFRAAARLENSLEVASACPLTFLATGPKERKEDVSTRPLLLKLFWRGEG